MGVEGKEREERGKKGRGKEMRGGLTPSIFCQVQVQVQ